ncbi:hypothetical protein QE152_g52 [Popillia japonica]|uniref:Uncharacterized protein n=1 Tax=Popillia japonica TaxID=7064 RepID=A0AAW1NMH1_POPJA
MTEEIHTPKFMMTFKDVEETVTTYDGGDTYPINRWISEFEEIATLMDWDDVEKLIYGKSHWRSQKTTPKFMMTFKDVEETVTTYDGGDTYPINRWISEFEEIATLMDWDDVEKLIYGKRLLKGEALLFVRSERGITSWEILKTKLRNEFSGY